MPTADLYARKSTKDAGRSVARQERAWRADCLREGITPGRVFVDPDLSASRYASKQRPDYEALLEHIRGKNCEMVSLWEISRGSRRLKEWVPFVELCEEMGVRIRVFDEEDPYTFDPRRPRDRDTLYREGVKAEFEVEGLRARTKAGAADAALQGRPAGGPLPDGYRRVYSAPSGDSKMPSGHKRLDIALEIDEGRAWIYRAAAEGLLNGVPAQTLARILMAFDVPNSAGGKRWTGGALWTALLKPTMEGHRVYNGVVVAENAWPAIIDSQTMARLRHARAAPLPARNSGDTRLKHFLSGAMLCGKCRKPSMTGTAGSPASGVGPIYRCDGFRGGCRGVAGPRPQIEDLVRAMVVQRLRQPDAWAVFAPQPEDDAKVVEAQNHLDALIKRRDELYADAAKPDGPSMSLVANAERLLLPQIDAASAQVKELRKPKVLRGYDPLQLADGWDRYPAGERRAVTLALASVVLSPIGKGARPRWTPWRLAESRWHGDSRTWGDLWREAGKVPSVGG